MISHRQFCGGEDRFAVEREFSLPKYFNVEMAARRCQAGAARLSAITLGGAAFQAALPKETDH
jgi:hypothetical protein